MAERSSHSKTHLVLLHGWGLNQGVWQNILPLLEQTFQVVTPDLPGFGLQTDFPEDYQLTAVIDQLVTYIPEQSVVCGWSLGGLLAIAMAERYPAKVKQLGLIAASPCFLAQADWPGMRAEVMTQFAIALARNIEQTIQRFLSIQALGSENARQDIAQLKLALNAYPPPQSMAVKAALQLLATTDLRQSLAKLSMPIAGCFGRLDSLVPVTILPLLQQLQPQARFHVLPKASHAPFISHPTEFANWLTSVFD